MQAQINTELSTFHMLRNIYPDKLFLNKNETGNILGISESGVLNYINSNNSVKLKSTKFGTSSKSALRIKLSDLATFIDELSSQNKEK